MRPLYPLRVLIQFLFLRRVEQLRKETYQHRGLPDLNLLLSQVIPVGKFLFPQKNNLVSSFPEVVRSMYEVAQRATKLHLYQKFPALQMCGLLQEKFVLKLFLFDIPALFTSLNHLTQKVQF